ncbi:hypothetical protein T439DRAFT_344770, partial [Meredithblackwellia eburnea MCA 4105]
MAFQDRHWSTGAKTNTFGYRSHQSWPPVSPSSHLPTSPHSPSCHTPHRSPQQTRIPQTPSNKTYSNENSLDVFGDSFTGVLTLLDSARVRVTKFKGASARGLSNPNSKLKAGEAILSALDRQQQRRRNVLLVFGAVDFHINWLWQLKTKGSKHGILPAAWVELVFTDYARFLVDKILPLLLNGQIKNLYISGVPLPVVEDAHLEQSIEKY